MHIRGKTLEWLFALALRRGKLLLAVMGASTVVLACFIPRLTIVSSYSALVSPDRPEQARFLEFLQEFGAADDLVVVLEGEPEVLKANAPRFAREISREKKLVKNVFYRIGLERMLARAPLYAPREALREGVDALIREQALVRSISQVGNLPRLLDLIEKNFTSESPEGGMDPREIAAALRGMGAFWESGAAG